MCTTCIQGINKISLDEIENAAFVVHLDDRRPETWSETGMLSLHGEGTTRWLDKSFNLIIFANGQASVHAEHSWADAPVGHLSPFIQAATSPGHHSAADKIFRISINQASSASHSL